MDTSFVKSLYLNPIVSWLVTLIGILFLLLPSIIAWKISKHRFPQWKYTSIGASFGITAIPLSLWLYMQYFVGPIRALIFGFLGLFMMIIHMAPMAKVTIPFLLDATDTTSSTWGTPVLKHLIGGTIFWVSIYGAMGLVLDFIRKRRKVL